MAMINNANDVLFDLCTRLKDNGVVAKASGNYEFSEDNTRLDFVERISELDFTEHDKGFKDEINRLKENITDCHTVSDEEHVGYDWTDITHCIDNLVKETVVDAERHKLIFKR